MLNATSAGRQPQSRGYGFRVDMERLLPTASPLPGSSRRRPAQWAAVCALAAALARLEQLTPGDFAAVRRQVDILATAFTPEEFVAQLEAEHRLKPEVRERRGMGFTH